MPPWTAAPPLDAPACSVAGTGVSVPASSTTSSSMRARCSTNCPLDLWVCFHCLDGTGDMEREKWFLREEQDTINVASRCVAAPMDCSHDDRGASWMATRSVPSWSVGGMVLPGIYASRRSL